MENNNDFFQKFEMSKSSSSNVKSVFKTVLISFISAIVGAVCAVLIYSNFSTAGSDTVDTASGQNNSISEVFNANLSQVSLSNYSDTAIYAANKALPSMVSISVEYDINYMGLAKTSSGSGSGVIISEDGYILTNNHVISSSDSSSFYQVSDANQLR